jgi:hypothetical protein
MLFWLSETGMPPVVVSVGRLAMKSFLCCGSSTLLPVSGRDDDQDAELAALAELKLDRHDYLLLFVLRVFARNSDHRSRASASRAAQRCGAIHLMPMLASAMRTRILKK